MLRRNIMPISIRVIVLAAVLAWMGMGERTACAASVTVQFSATINQTAFSLGDLAVGRTIMGYYSYDPDAIPSLGPNYANYTLLGASSSAGLNTWKAGSADLNLAHSIGFNPDPGLFETKDFFLVFLGGSGERAEVGARIDSIRVAPEPGNFTLLSLAAVGLLLGRVWQRRKQGKAHKLRT
jgi:hypothetical protein